MYIGNGCPEPTGACCVGIACVATVTEDSCNVLGGDWYIGEDCSTFVCPYGACCLGDGLCTATTSENDCDALGGTWYQNQTCPEYICPITACSTAIYTNGPPTGGARASQCDPFYPMAAETADDFILPGTGTVDIGEVISWIWHFNGPPGASPADYLGINVTIYANDTISMAYPAPGGKPIHGDTLCQHMELIPGGIVYTVELAPGEYTYVPEGGPMWRLMLPICVTLNAGETYWLAVEPIMSFAAFGQCGAVPTDIQTGNGAEMIFELLGMNVWTPRDPIEDLAFCLIEAPPPVWSCIEEPCTYAAPDNKQPGGIGDIEPNDACTLAVEALCEYAYCGDITTNADDDWYYVDLPQDTTYGVHVRVFANDTPNQYAYGGGLDSRVYLLRSDCDNLALAASNDDYGGTFPDAENYDSQLDPGYPNCFQPGERVYIRVDGSGSASSGPYLLIINCVPCEMPTGACCVDDECVATNFENECDALGGYWYAYETCPDFDCPPDCGPAIYTNGDVDGWPNSYGSQCLTDYSGGVSGEVADDFVLPGTDPVNIGMVIAWFGHWNGPADPTYYSGVNVTIYSNDIISLPYPAPGGKPTPIGDPLCTHIQLIPGGIVFDTLLTPGEYSYVEDQPGSWRLMLPIDVTLTGGETYWLGVEPHMPLFTAGQSGWNNIPAPDTTGNSARQIFEALGLTPWTPLNLDMAFCLLEAIGCDYVVGDVNGSVSYNGLDITYGVNFFKGGADPMCPFGSCPIPPCDAFFYCGDVNGSCSYNGLDITYGVNFFKGGDPPIPCPDCPPVGSPAGDINRPETPSVIKTKAIFEQKPGTK